MANEQIPGMEKEAHQKWKSRRIYVFTAWASVALAIVISVALLLLIATHQGKRGERPTAVLLFDLFLLLASMVGGLMGIYSLFGIRSWRNALVIIPGAVLGIGINVCNAFFSFFAYALEGRNLGG